jgi:hypothetical protein
VLRAIKWCAILAVLGAVGLLGYSFLLEPGTAPVTTTIEIDAG